jgi:hypothetical protein
MKNLPAPWPLSQVAFDFAHVEQREVIVRFSGASHRKGFWGDTSQSPLFLPSYDYNGFFMRSR